MQSSNFVRTASKIIAAVLILVFLTSCGGAATPTVTATEVPVATEAPSTEAPTASPTTCHFQDVGVDGVAYKEQFSEGEKLYVSIGADSFVYECQPGKGWQLASINFDDIPVGVEIILPFGACPKVHWDGLMLDVYTSLHHETCEYYPFEMEIRTTTEYIVEYTEWTVGLLACTDEDFSTGYYKEFTLNFEYPGPGNWKIISTGTSDGDTGVSYWIDAGTPKAVHDDWSAFTATTTGATYKARLCGDWWRYIVEYQ